ncbi:stigma-specific STIG1-like protein 1 [Vitis riparia]|uniref:stigma-specific STIG1-like protein 1 n=1 Tax=Vitis riparia TaxID=96939 RepID=UPI00155ADEFD|nr:stigma-specific STIG1-like protein 1 [Vitis riparia]
MAMKLLKLLFILSITTSIVSAASSANENNEDNSIVGAAWTADENKEDSAVESHLALPEGEETTSSIGTSDFRLQNKYLICDKFPQICRRKSTPGPDCCQKKCVNLTKDPNNCGECRRKCRHNYICCSGHCVNPYVDPLNCALHAAPTMELSSLFSLALDAAETMEVVMESVKRSFSSFMAMNEEKL